MHYLGQVQDLPLPQSGRPRLRTRRKPLAQIVLCQGCCCGQTDRGMPAVPLDWLKPIWKTEKLNKVVQLTISGCLGPCDLPNVCCIVTPDDQTWYGRLTTKEDYGVLLDWARRCRAQNQLVPLPAELEHLRFQRWPSGGQEEPFTPVVQDSADIILLTAADTEILTWSAAAARLPAGFPSVRALNLDRLRDPRVFDAYLDDVLQECRVLLIRLLGGLGYWREQVEQLRLLALAHEIKLIVLPGDNHPDPQLASLSTVSAPVAGKAFRYCIEGGIPNAERMLRYLSDTFLGTRFGCEEPAELPEIGIYHPSRGEPLSLEAWRQRFGEPERPTAGVVFYRSHWVTGNLGPIDELVCALESRGLNVLAVFGPNLQTVLAREFLPGNIDVLITTTSFSISSTTDMTSTDEASQRTGLELLNVPVLQAIFCSSSENVWAANKAGLSPRDIAMNVALPEFDGRIITTAVSFKNTLSYDPIVQTDIVRYQPRADRVRHVADLARKWAALRKIPNAQKKIAILLANYPSKNARVGNAVGLDTPASLHAVLLALAKAGYDIGPTLPTDGQSLIEALIETSIQDPEFASGFAHNNSAGWVTKEQYHAWLGACSLSAKQGIEDRWGSPDQSPQFISNRDETEVTTTHYSPLTTPHSCGFPIPGLVFGNIFVGIQPARGYDQDPAAVYHSPDLPPPPYYLAFYRWIRDVFGAHAVIHLGKHGNLEWLPGKGSALSESCYPEIVLQDLPNIYPYIINNPGEGAQAKRRTAAVIVDHLIPPMTQAGTYGELRQLENLLDEYYTIQSLDPTKEPLVLERLARLVEESRIYRDLELAQTPSIKELPDLLKRLDCFLCEIKEAQIRDGLHILGRLPDGEQLAGFLFSLVRVDNGSVPGLLKALAQDFGLDYAALTTDPAAPALSVSFPCSAWECLGKRSASFEKNCHPRTNGDIIERLNDIGRHLIEECLKEKSFQSALTNVSEDCQRQLANSARTLEFLWHVIWPRLQLCHQEIDQILTALAGRFVPPGPSGAPTRGRADVLPTGRNFYSLDVRTIPTPTAWQVGCAAADALLERHRQRHGAFPESIAMVVWGTSNMRTGGDDIAEILFLLGVRPCWDEDNRRVIGIEPISLSDLGRPRIDVTIRISGLFRDAFPNLVRLLNDAVALAARLEEPLDRNYVKAHIARDTALLSRGLRIEDRGSEESLSFSRFSTLDPRSSLSLQEAARIAGLRVFGSKPGAYGAGLLPLIDNRNWHEVEDLAEVFLTWSSYAYTGSEETQEEADGREEREALRLRLAQTEIVAQNQDNREHDIFDSDDYFQFHGGLIASVRAITGTAPEAYFGDTSRPDDVRARTLKEEACRVFRARVVNPRWLAGVMRHGYKGAVEMAATVDYLFGYDATTEVLEDWMYERLAGAYLFAESVRDFLRRHNPWAERAMIERLLEAAQRGLWERPDPDTLQNLIDQYGANDFFLEGRSKSLTLDKVEKFR
jgi:cobaltochelatase CobN